MNQPKRHFSPEAIRKLSLPVETAAAPPVGDPDRTMAIHLPQSLEELTGKPVAALQASLAKLRHAVDPAEVAESRLGPSTREAVRRLQASAGLMRTGVVTPETAGQIKRELEHRYFTDAPHRAAKIQGLLTALGHDIDEGEIAKRRVGTTTAAALQQFRQRTKARGVSWWVDEGLVQRLRSEALGARLASRTQFGKAQRTLQRAMTIASLDVPIGADELSTRQPGPGTQAALRAFQAKYRLPASGRFDLATMDKVEAVAASRPTPAKQLKVKSALNLDTLKRQAKLNMRGGHVAAAQKALAHFGYPVPMAEHGEARYGKATRKAVLAFQTDRALPATGQLDGRTLQALNTKIKAALPADKQPVPHYRLRGSVRDELWRPVPGAQVRLAFRSLEGPGKSIATRITSAAGFYDIAYDPPRDPNTGDIVKPLHLIVTFTGPTKADLGSRILFNPTPIQWTNQTIGDRPYRGPSLYERQRAALDAVLGGLGVTDLVEDGDRNDITIAALEAGLTQYEVMRLVLAVRAAKHVGDPALGAALYFGFIAQGLPSTLPEELLTATDEWTRIDELTADVAAGILLLGPEKQSAAFARAADDNLVPIALVRDEEAVLTALTERSVGAVLDAPPMGGDASLQLLLDASKLEASHYNTVATMLLAHGETSEAFWTDLTGAAADLGGDAVVADVAAAIETAAITAGHGPAAAYLKQQLDDPDLAGLQSPRQLATLSTAQWQDVVANTGYPAGTPGEGPAEQAAAYALQLETTAAAHYPTTALIAELGRTDGHGLTLVGEAAAFIDAHPDLELKTTGLDAYVRTNELDLDADLHAELRVEQRAVRLAPGHKAASALLAEKLHSAAQIAALDRTELAARIGTYDGVTSAEIHAVHATAQLSYAHVLSQLATFQSDLAPGQFHVFNHQTITLADATGALGDIPDLALLFGGLDYCECSHCESVYGPSAYLADLLRFLSTRPAKPSGPTTILQVLQARRPDIDDLLLNCPNTNTTLPYIDLVNELLERAVPGAPAPQPQTTRTTAELRAVPEHLHAPAYETVKAARFPLRGAFNAWQEEARVILAHLGVPRHELMRLLGPATPAAHTSAAGEYFGLSTLDAQLIATAAPAQVTQDQIWGLDTTEHEVGVLPFLHHSGLTYTELLALLDTVWIHTGGPIELQRPEGTCKLEEQSLTGLDPAHYDRLHRLIRLWRHTTWTATQLDRLLRAPGLAAGALDAQALRRLAAFDELAGRLRLNPEQALVLYAPLSTEPGPDDTRSPYEDLFANPNLLDPVDPAFALPLPGTEPMAAHLPALAAAWQVGEADLGLLLARTGPNLTVADLTKPLRYVTLANALRLPIADLLSLVDLTSDLPGPFGEPGATAAFADRYGEVKAAGLAVGEVDWLLNDRPDAPYGQRDEAIAEQLDALRESLRTTPAEEVNGQIAATVASMFSLPDEQAVTLLDLLRPDLALWEVFANPDFMAADEEGNYVNLLTETLFAELYEAWRLLHKAAYLVRRMRIDAADLPWLMDHAAEFGWVHPGALPVAAADPALPLEQWRDLASWLGLRFRYPKPEETGWPEVFDAAAAGDPVADVRVLVSALTGWDPVDLEALDGDAAAYYTDVDNLVRTRVAAEALRRLGVSAADALGWVDRDADAGGAQRLATEHLRQTMKAKYDTGAWLTLMPNLQDPLREARRDALTAYLVEHSLRTTPETITAEGREWVNPKHWKDTNDLQRWFLLDTEMMAVQQTSRIKQAIGAVQLFAQRCLLNLEQPLVRITAAQTADTLSLDSWSQWEWMSGYRLWEANRKVFLYPENWIEAELRDDKTPFFKELEDQLSQGELTDANAEKGYRDYLRKLTEVAHMQTLGVYHEQSAGANLLHVIARSASQPSHCYYRALDLTYGEWTGWERVDVDIASEQVAPVVYRGRLHLFWLQFEEKTQQPKRQPPAQISDSPGTTADPARTLEIELCWSERTPDGWTSRRTSGDKLIHPWPRPQSSYTLKPRARSNQLWMDVFISSSPEFNDGRFYDEFADAHVRMTKRNYSVLHWPWHSSSFVFTGEVVDLKMKPMYGNYTRRSDGTLFTTDSLWHVQTNFGEQGRAIKALTSSERAPKLRKPETMRFANGRLAAQGSTVDVMIGWDDTRHLLTGARTPAELVMAPNARQYNEDADSPVIYQDRERAYWLKRTSMTVTFPFVYGGGQIVHVPVTTVGHRWFPFWHPYASDFLAALDTTGVEGLVTRKQQSVAPNWETTFSYGPTSGNWIDPTAQGGVDFTRGGAYAAYNWEVFFHAPMLIAAKLTAEHRFEEAMRWYHRIFDPTSTDGPEAPQRYWVTRPFFENSSEDYRQQRIESILGDIGDHLEELRAWKNNPFSPHTIARYRPVAYQKTIVMKYLDNLIGWADQEFRRDTLESINQAVLLYTLASELLGRRPEKVPPAEREDKSYTQLTEDSALDPFGNQDVAAILEGFAPPLGDPPGPGLGEPLPHLEVQYFGIPVNDKLIGYWDTVADRLFKVRNSLNIEGVFRQLPLFEPPIDPGMLVKAAAAGADLSSILGLFTATDTRYRFPVLANRAVNLCAELRALGEKLLRILETRDAESLALLRSSQEVILNQAIEAVRELQGDEAVASRASLEAGRDALNTRISFHGSVPRMNGEEIAGVVMQTLGLVGNAVSAVMSGIAGSMNLIPDFSIGIAGFGGSPTVSMSIGGSNISGFMANTAAMVNGFAGMLHTGAGMAQAQGRYSREFEDHLFNRDLAANELVQLEAQIAASQIREQIAAAELANHLQIIADSEAVEEYLRTKYTNVQLYDWMLARVSTVYFQAYQIAFDVAMLAQASYQFELAEPDASFIQFGYWDSLRKGLLAPERLTNDIRRMESSYMELNQRNLEITKHVSLAQIDPLALLALKLTGQATVQLPEWLFDLDYPGHIRRRLKSVALSVPCVVGPYTSVNCTLAVTNNGVRLDDSVAGGYGDPLAGGDARFWKSPVPTTVIATSHAVNDRGMFELRFEDERFLPFEGAGAVSEWTISLPKAHNQFDLGSITDLVLHLDYTARAGGPGLIALAVDNLDAVLPTSGAALFVLEEQFGTAWHRMLFPDGELDQELAFALTTEHLPFWAKVRAASEPVKVTAADLILDTVHTDAFTVSWQLPGQMSAAEVPGANDPGFGGAPHSAVAPVPAPSMLGEWRMRLKRAVAADYRSLLPEDVRRAYLLVQFDIG